MQDFECIVVNDGSTDGTLEEALEAIDGDERFRTYTTENSGLSVARNFALDRAEGEFIAYADADDVPHPDFLLHPIEFAEAGNLDIVFFDAKVENCGLDERQFLKERNYFSRLMVHGIGSGRDILAELAETSDFIAPVYLQTARRSAVRHRFIEGILYEDEPYTVQNFLSAGRVGYLPERLYERRCRPNSICSSKKRLLSVYSKWRSAQAMKAAVLNADPPLDSRQRKAVGSLAETCLRTARWYWTMIGASEQEKISLLPPDARMRLIEDLNAVSG